MPSPHNKIMLIDGDTIITGSFNFTKAAEESNAENLLVLRDKPPAFCRLGHFPDAVSSLVKGDSPCAIHGVA